MRLIDADLAKEKIGNLDGYGVIGRCLDEIPTVQAIPISELQKLLEHMDKMLTETDGEQKVLWSCEAMLADCIEDYEQVYQSGSDFL